MLSEEVFEAVLDTQVDPEIGRNDTGTFLFLNLVTLETKFKIPPSARRRVSREGTRQALLKGVGDHVHWSKRLSDIRISGDTVTAMFEDGVQVDGTVLIGAEGSNSKTRQFLLPNSYHNYQLPVRFVGVSLDMTLEQVAPLRALDPLLFQGCHPDTGVYLWVSMLHVPQAEDLDKVYRVQINLSWTVKDANDEVPPDSSTRLQQMKSKALGFHPTLKTVIDGIPTGTEVLEIKLADWPCQQWDNRGLVTLAGDSAHAMTMYRGEAANHGILDASELLAQLQRVQCGDVSLQSALNEYETAMRERAATAVLLSRQACLDAHDFHGLNANSAVLKRRAITGV